MLRIIRWLIECVRARTRGLINDMIEPAHNQWKRLSFSLLGQWEEKLFEDFVVEWCSTFFVYTFMPNTPHIRESHIVLYCA